jgi:hypothetical protein
MPKREPLKVTHCWASNPDVEYTWEEFLPMLLERHKDAPPIRIWVDVDAQTKMEAMNNEARSNAS